MPVDAPQTLLYMVNGGKFIEPYWAVEHQAAWQLVMLLVPLVEKLP